MRLFVESIVSGVAAMQLLFFVPTLNHMTSTLNLLSTCNLQPYLFAVLFAFVPVLFAGMQGMENKKSTQYCMDNYWIRSLDLCRFNYYACLIDRFFKGSCCGKNDLIITAFRSKCWVRFRLFGFVLIQCCGKGSRVLLTYISLLDKVLNH